MIFSAIVPLLVLVCVYGLYTGLRDKRDYRPFLSSLGLFILCFAGLSISFYPYIVPPSLSIWDAAAPDKSLGFLLVGADPCLHRLFLLGLPRQGRSQRRLSLMGSRLLWFAGLWLAGVLVVASLGYAIKLVIG